MRVFSAYVATVITSIVVLSGCDGANPLDASEEAVSPPAGAHAADVACTVESGGVLIRGYVICLDDVVRAGSDDPTTTFTYSVHGTGTPPELSHFVIGIDSCDPSLTIVGSTTGAIEGTDPTTGVTGLKWDGRVGINASAQYSVTFAGDVPVGTTTIAVKSGRGFDVGEIGGAGCSGATYSISGTVFIDADVNQAKSDEEFGIANVTVELVDGTGSVVAAVLTQGNGDYLFADRPEGSYTLRIPASTPGTDFNEQLASSFIATTPASIALELDADSPDNDFGFDLDADHVTSEFDSGALTSTAEDIKFWREQVNKALSGKGAQNSAVVSKEELQRLLDLIEGELQVPGIKSFLPEPFLFGAPGNAGDEDLQIALQILNPPNNLNLPHEEFLAALLMAELNYTSGRDIHNAPGLLESILAWSEALYAGESTTSKNAAVAAELSKATRLLLAYGGSGGIDN